jgi:phage-related holin
MFGGGVILPFVAPIAPLCALCVTFTAIDFITGIVVSYRLDKSGFQSKKAWRTIFKLCGSLTCIMMAFFFEKFIFEGDNEYFARSVAGIVCAFDFWSILGHFARLSNHPVFRYLQKYMKSEIEGKIKKTNSE